MSGTLVNTVVKVQRPLLSTQRNAPWLVYDRLRRITKQIPEDRLPVAVRTALTEDAKAYFNARVDLKSNAIVFGRRAADQSW